MSRIVVGVDGSEGSQRALEFAVREAKQRGAGLRVVMTWEEPTMVFAGGFVPPVPSDAEYEKGAQQVLDRALEAANGQLDGIHVEKLVRKGHAADVLVDESENADLLVVGSRGLGGFKGMLLGSVSRQCTQHAHCPVTVVPKS
ncbi:MAG: universal stress protein [Gaiellaceae bacterium]